MPSETLAAIFPSTMPYIEYDNTPDLFDNRRLSRTRFLAHNLPVVLGFNVLFPLTAWLLDRAAGTTGTSFGHIGSAVAVFVAAAYLLLRWQNGLLERRCNDAGRGWRVSEWLLKIAAVSAAIGGVLPAFGLPVFLVIWIQVLFGLYLPANPHPNISGAPRPDTSAVRLAAWTAVGFLLLTILWYKAV